MVKKKSEKIVKEEECCTTYGNNCCRLFLLKLGSMAFILFLITVWKGLGDALMSVHWGIYLGIFLLLIIIAMAGFCKYKKK